MPSEEKLAKKQIYFDKLIHHLETSPIALLVNVDNVGSKQMQDIRIELRGKATILMGKNTMIRTALRNRAAETGDEGLERLCNVMRGNIGFIFVNDGELDTVRACMSKNVHPAAARTGVVAPVDVFLPAGGTGLGPEQTSFFQALNIATKIVKGAIECTSETHVVVKGSPVGASAVALLAKLGIKPFEYGMTLKMVYQNGSVFDAKVLDITDAVLTEKFMAGVQNVAAFGREIGIPTEAGLPHMVANAFKNIAALVSDIDYTFPEVEIVKEYLKDPSKFAAATTSAAPAAAGGAAPAAAAVVEEEEEEEDMDFDLFG